MYVVPMAREKDARVPLEKRWTPPPPGWIKLNTDASFISSDKPSGGGAILAACSPLKNCQDAEDAEAKAALMGIKLLNNRGHDKIMLELDCSEVVKALNSTRTDRSKQWASYEEAKTLLRSFDGHSIGHEKRECNRLLMQ
ncbi:hypothetical protein ACQ4PT_018864 [Festuca glaucescens]